MKPAIEYTKPSPVKSLILLSITVGFCFFSTGWSVVGFGMGAAIDASKPPTRHIDDDFLNKARKDKLITATMTDSTAVIGRYEGATTLPDSLYAESFDRAGVAPDVSPHPGDTVTITTDMTTRTVGVFQGYDLKPRNREIGDYRYAYGAFVPTVFRLGDPATGDTTDVFLHRIRSISTTDSSVYDMAHLRGMAESDQLPLRTALLVSSEAGPHYLPPNRIATIDQPNKRNAKWKLLAIGAIIDATTIAIIALTGGFEMNMGWN